MPLCLWFLLLSDFSFQCCVIFVSTFLLYLCKMFIFRNALYFPPPPASAFLFRFNCIFMFVFGIYILMGEVFPTGNQLWHFREWLKNYFSVCCEKCFFFRAYCVFFLFWSVFFAVHTGTEGALPSAVQKQNKSLIFRHYIKLPQRILYSYLPPRVTCEIFI